jgi:hypothetical protein
MDRPTLPLLKAVILFLGCICFKSFFFKKLDHEILCENVFNKRFRSLKGGLHSVSLQK